MSADRFGARNAPWKWVSWSSCIARVPPLPPTLSSIVGALGCHTWVPKETIGRVGIQQQRANDSEWASLVGPESSLDVGVDDQKVDGRENGNGKGRRQARTLTWVSRGCHDGPMTRP